MIFGSGFTGTFSSLSATHTGAPVNSIIFWCVEVFLLSFPIYAKETFMKDESRTAPQWMTGIKQGDWQQVSKPQLKAKQRPCYPMKTRVWATLILHRLRIPKRICGEAKEWNQGAFHIGRYRA